MNEIQRLFAQAVRGKKGNGKGYKAYFQTDGRVSVTAEHSIKILIDMIIPDILSARDTKLIKIERAK